MLFGIPLSELAFLAGAIAVGGIVTGILAGMFGIGGGGVIVPVLFEVFRALGVPEEVRMQLCVGTSIAIIVPTNLWSYRTHVSKGMVDRNVVSQWALPAVLGVLTGALIASFAPGSVFQASFSIIGTTIALKLLFGRESWKINDQLPGPWVMRAYGYIVGLGSSLMGISGGSISNMILSLHGRSIHSSVGTASGVGVYISIAGAIGFMISGWPHRDLLPPLSIGFVSLLGLVLMAPISSYMASYGAVLAHRLSRRTLEIAFGLFLLTTATRFTLALIL